MTDPQYYLDLDHTWCAHNYHPLPVVLTSGEGAYVTDITGQRYLDLLAGYSALNFGHRHPDLIAAASAQLGTLTLTSRAFHHDLLGPFCQELAELTGTEMVLPMNTGAEAVETALKIARKWAYEAKGVATDQAEIVVAGNNFHGRTLSIVSFSTDPVARAGYGPFTPGFRQASYGSIEELEALVSDRTAAILLEPIQGEAGVIVPPPGYLAQVRALCDAHNVLLIADEIQSGLGRTGAVLALEHEQVRADLYTLGKALGGGIMPVSAVVGRRDVLGLLQPGQHGSTFGGNPLACAVGRAVIRLLRTSTLLETTRTLGAHLHASLAELVGHGVAAVRGRGLWAGVDISDEGPTGREVSLAMAKRGYLIKETQERTLRVAPPLVITRQEIDATVAALSDVVRR